jgi:4-amino-4-deoxy-L-arabinose transferase-like glycosyltransferase
MENLYFGITTIAICLLGYIIAFRQYSRNNVPLALIIVMLCGLLLRIYTASDFHLHPWDERYHALVAKNMMDSPLRPMLYENPLMHYDFRNWATNQIWVHKQPLPLWSMALSMSIFGVNEIALRLPSIILSTLGIGITFYIARFLFNNRVGIITAFLFSIHGLIIELTAGRVATDHIDIFFLFFIELSVLLAIKFFQSEKGFYNVLCGVSIGLAILTKWLPALIVLPIWLLLAMHSKPFILKKTAYDFLLLCFVIALISVPWQIYIFNAFPLEAAWESSYNSKHLSEALENHGQPFYYHLDKLRIVYGELIYLPMIWFFYKSYKNPRPERLMLGIWILIPFLFFSIANTKMQAYTLFTAPAIFIVTALFWEYLYAYRDRFKYKGFIIGVLILLIALPVRYTIERIKPFTIRNRNPQWAQELRALGRHVNNETVVFNAEHPIETMFYTDCVAYPGIPDSLILSNISQEGYTIFERRETLDNVNTTQEGEDIVLTGYYAHYIIWKPN